MTTAVSPRNLHPPRQPDREDDENRFYDNVAFATDDAIPWIIGSLRLGKCDLSRMRSSGCPVLRNHIADRLVGAVTRVEKADGVWRSNWRLPKIAANADTFDQMDSAVLRGISVGGNLDWSTLAIENEDEVDWGDPDSIVFRADWQIVENSLTALPADTRAGIDRVAVEVLERAPAIFDTIISSAGITTLDTPDVHRRLQTLVHEHNFTLQRKVQGDMTTQTQIPPDVLQRAVAEEMTRNEALKRFTEIPDKLDKLTAEIEDESKRNMEYRAKLDGLQFGGSSVLQANNWQPGVNRVLDLGKILRLTLTDDIGVPALDKSTDVSLEESVIERAELRNPGRNVVGRIPWAALAAREEQLASSGPLCPTEPVPAR